MMTSLKLGKVNLKLCLGIAGVQLLGYALYRAIKTAFFSKLLKVPGLQYGPIYGNLKESMQGEAMETSVRWVKKHGGIVRFYHFLGEERLLLADVEAIRHVLVTNCPNYLRPTGVISTILTEGLFVVEGQKHRAERKLLNPSLNSAAVRGFIPLFSQTGAKLVRKIQDLIQSDTESRINVQLLIKCATMDVIGLAAFNQNIAALDDPLSELVQSIKLIISVQERTLLYSLPFSNYLPTSRNRQLKQAKKVIDKFLYEAIREKRQKGGTEDNILGKLIDARYEDGVTGLTDHAVKEHSLTFMVAGHETSSGTLTWLLHELSQHSEIQDKLYEEVTSVEGDSSVSAESIDSLPFLDACLKETMRLYPAAPSIARKTLHNDIIGGYEVPAGTTVICHMGTMMRTIVEDGETFRPERFMEEGINSRQWLPFGIGPHACIGNKFALTEMKVLLIDLIKNFKFRPVPDLKIKRKYRITLRSVPDVELLVSRR